MSENSVNSGSKKQELFRIGVNVKEAMFNYTEDRDRFQPRAFSFRRIKLFKGFLHHFIPIYLVQGP